MRCLVVILSVVACARVSLAAAGVTCVLSEEFFLRHNVTADDNEEPGPICGGQCCGRGSEVKLRSSLRKVVDTSTVASTKWTAELLLSTRRSLQDHLTRLSQLSQNKTATFFTQVYRGHASRTVRPLAALYDDIRIVLRSTPEINGTSDSLHIEIPKDLAVSAKRFFRDIFPVAYHNMLKLDSKQFTPEYEACLKDAYEAVLPFGDIPQQLGSSLSRSLETARALLQMLAEGAEVLATTDQVLSSASDACSERLLRLAGCSRCHGHTVLPCKNYCLNVARGCIGSLLVELNHPWAGYVEAVERLTKVDADVALRELETKVSNAIMYAIENTAVSENKVRQECGPASTIEPSGSSLSHPSPGMIRREYLRAPPPDTELLQFAATLATTKNLFGDLADRLCDQPDFSVEDTLDNCWNGNAVADYSKPLVKLESLSDQKYNPEIGEHPPEDRRVAILADRLQQAKQLLISYSRRNEAPAESFMQGDEAGEEGSGSGRNYPDDYDTDTEGSGDDGSGDSDGQSRSSLNESPPDSSTPRTSGSHAFHPAQHALLLAIIYTALTHTT